MSDNKTDINDDVLDMKKKILIDKEEDIMRSQIKRNKLGEKIRKLELKKENIIKGNKWILGNIIFTAIYDIIMITILILFVIFFINKISLIILLSKTIYVIGVSLGVITISVIGAYISANIGEKLKSYCNQKRILSISKNIKEKEVLLSGEICKQENLKKEITNIMNDLDNNMEMNVIESRNNLISYFSCDILNIDNKTETKEIVNIKKKIKR